MLSDVEYGFFLGGIEGSFLAFVCFSMLQLLNSSAISNLEMFSYYLAVIGFLGALIFPFFVLFLSILLRQRAKDPVFI